MRRNRVPWYVFVLPEAVGALVALVFFAVYALGLWLIWISVVPGLWESGPNSLTSPGYLPFFGALFILRCLGYIALGRPK